MSSAERRQLAGLAERMNEPEPSDVRLACKLFVEADTRFHAAIAGAGATRCCAEP